MSGHAFVIWFLLIAFMLNPVAQAAKSISADQDRTAARADKDAMPPNCDNCHDNPLSCDDRPQSADCSLTPSCLSLSCLDFAAVFNENICFLPAARNLSCLVPSPTYIGYAPIIDPRPPRI